MKAVLWLLKLWVFVCASLGTCFAIAQEAALGLTVRTIFFDSFRSR